MEENGTEGGRSSVEEPSASMPGPAEVDISLRQGSSAAGDLQESEAGQILGAVGDIQKVCRG